jgi:hypothetical protein
MSVSEQGLLEAQWLYELHRQARGRRPSPPAPAAPAAPWRPRDHGAGRERVRRGTPAPRRPRAPA